jgi:hypothetical protein
MAGQKSIKPQLVVFQFRSRYPGASELTTSST